MKRSNRERSPTNRDECPDPERLAALIEGKLPELHQKPVLHHLQHCNECRDLVADGISLLRELPGDSQALNDQENSHEVPVYRIRRWGEAFRKRSRYVKGGLAAMVAGMTLVVSSLISPTAEWSADKLLSPLSDRHDLLTISRTVIQQKAQSPIEHLGFSEEYSPQKVAFNAGRFTCQLAIVAKADLSEPKALLLAQTPSLLEKAALPLNDEELLKLSADEVKEQYRSHYLNLEKQYEGDPAGFYFQLGLMAESAKGLAQVGKARQFDWTFLEYLTRQSEFKNLPLGVRSRLNKIIYLIGDKAVAGKDQKIYNLLKDVAKILS